MEAVPGLRDSPLHRTIEITIVKLPYNVVRAIYQKEKARTVFNHMRCTADLRIRKKSYSGRPKIFIHPLIKFIMHWIQTLREHLQINQEDMSHYLRVSIHTIQSVELGRRSLPAGSLMAAVALFDAIKNAQSTRVAIDLPTQVPHQQMRRAKQLHRQCCRKLERSIGRLDKMKKSHTTACFALGVYQLLAQSLSTPATEEDQARLVWAQRQINDTRQRINDFNPAAQNLLAAEIVGLKNVAHSLDLIQLNAEYKTPITKGPEPLSL